jgi:peptidoglycan-associated lipoprotein
MNGSNRKYLWLVVLLIGLLALSGCPKQAEMTMTPEEQQEAPAADQAGSERQTEAAKSEDEQARERAAAAAAPGPQPVYFDFDQSLIRDDAREVMKTNAEWLKANPQARIKIEGNCDERGTIEYNQALGQRRAANAKKYLTDLGIPGHRISIISYGKEKSSCTESTENCWQKNRRDDFVPVSD